MTSKELIVRAILLRNKNCWITNSSLIADITNQTIGNVKLSQIELRAIIQNLRAMGEPIIASEKGYKYTTSIHEIKDYCKARRTEIEKELRVLGSMELKQEERINKEIK